MTPETVWTPIILSRGFRETKVLSRGIWCGETGETEIFDDQTFWYLKKPFIIGVQSNSVLHFFYSKLGDATGIGTIIAHAKTGEYFSAIGGLRIIKMEKLDEIQRLIEAIPDDLALCLDIVWAKPLIEAYFKKVS